MSQDSPKTFIFIPSFNYKEFLDDGFLTDCTIIYHNEGNEHKIKAHIAIISSNSEFFFNAFTSGMSEQTTKTVDITVNPSNKFPEVLTFLYTGEIRLEDNNIMCILSIANFYGIPKLSQLIEQYLETSMNSSLLINCLKECYNFSLNNELNSLVKYVAKYIYDPNLPDQIDVGLFSEALVLVKLTPEEKIRLMKQFLEGYKLSDEEKQMIQKSIQKDDVTYKRMYQVSRNWFP